jgi:phosphohistidine phosphatase
MRVTLIRHGEAEARAWRDEDRALTKRGRADVRRVGQSLARHGARFSLIISSPLVRAVQTAEIVAEMTGYRRAIVVTRALIPDADATAIRELLAENGHATSVALVSHEPILSTTCALLLGVDAVPALKKSEAIRIRLADDLSAAGRFRWRIDPTTGKRLRR